MSWEVLFMPEALEDFKDLDGSQKKLVRKAIAKVSANPLSVEEGGYGKPLGNKGGKNLTGLFTKTSHTSNGLHTLKTL